MRCIKRFTHGRMQNQISSRCDATQTWSFSPFFVSFSLVHQITFSMGNFKRFYHQIMIGIVRYHLEIRIWSETLTLVSVNMVLIIWKMQWKPWKRFFWRKYLLVVTKMSLKTDLFLGGSQDGTSEGEKFST